MTKINVCNLCDKWRQVSVIETRMAEKGCALHHWVHDLSSMSAINIVILTAYVLTRFCLKLLRLSREQLLELALNLMIHCCVMNFEFLTVMIRSHLVEERGPELMHISLLLSYGILRPLPVQKHEDLI
ncbi:hypothetical protein Tco_0488576 [Tanacetum coccineum]